MGHRGLLLAPALAALLITGCTGGTSTAGRASPSPAAPSPTAAPATPAVETPEPVIADAGTVQLCSAGNLAEWEATHHRWQAAVDVMESAWRQRGLTAVASIRRALPPPGSLGADDTQTLVEVVDTLRIACVEGQAIEDLPGGSDVCGPLFDQGKPPSRTVERALSRRGYTYFDQAGVLGDIVVVTGVAQESADAHARATFFFRGDRLIGNDLRHGSQPHFDVNICSLVSGRAETSYWVGMGTVAPDPACPRGPRVIHMRWRITATAARPLDPVPGSCG